MDLRVFKDIRFLQITLMSFLLSLGVYIYDFSLLKEQVFLCFFVGFLTQIFWIKMYDLSYKSLLSAFITCFGIVLLLRSGNYWAHPLIAFLALSSKFLIQLNRRHIFNPTALGVVLALQFLPDTWVSPGQWGSHFLIATWVIAFGSLVTLKAKSFSISWFFLIFYISGLLIRNTYLGFEWAVSQHTLLNGALFVFSFFMISDPKTCPHHIYGKICQAFIVAFGALILNYNFYVTNAFIYILVVSSLFVPLINMYFTATPFQWSSNDKINTHQPKSYRLKPTRL